MPQELANPLVTLERVQTSDEGTFGKLTFKNSQLYTVELPWNHNQPRVSCIPAGAYLVMPYRSHRFGNCYKVKDVPGRSDILFHAANFGGDARKGYACDLKGCIGIVRRIGTLRAPNGKLQLAGLVSRPAFDMFMGVMGGAPFYLKITQPATWSTE